MIESKTSRGIINFRDPAGFIAISFYPEAKIARHKYQWIKCSNYEEALSLAKKYSGKNKPIYQNDGSKYFD